MSKSTMQTLATFVAVNWVVVPVPAAWTWWRVGLGAVAVFIADGSSWIASGTG